MTAIPLYSKKAVTAVITVTNYTLKGRRMMKHAYTKRQMKELKERNFDRWSYRHIDAGDDGSYLARLDCKAWGSRSIFLYLTTSEGKKLFAPVFIGSHYMGFMDIPIGAVVDITVDAVPGTNKAKLSYAEWIRGETDPAEAEKKCHETVPV